MNPAHKGTSSRRRFLATTGIALAWPGLAGAQLAVTEKNERQDLSLWYDQSAGVWVEALPVGNGRLGGMVFGRVAQERLQLNIDTLFGGSPYKSDSPDALAALPRIRALINEGHFAEAEALASKEFMARPIAQMPYGTAGDLTFDFAGLEAPTQLRRWLDLDQAVAYTRFVSGGVRHRRQVFCSEPDQVLVMQFESQGGSFDLDLGYRHPEMAEFYGAKAIDPRTSAVRLQGAAWDFHEPVQKTKRPTELEMRPDGDQALLITGHNIGDAGIPSGLQYALRVQLVGDGHILAQGDQVQVRGSRKLMLLIAGATSFVRYDDVSGDPVKQVRERTATAARLSYADLKQRHLRAHQAIFRRVALQIGAPGDDARPTNERIYQLPERPDPALAALYVQYARYLLLASSRPGSEPANLQGRWNEGNYGPWGCKYTININTEMNYWIASPGNLGECVEPLLRMVEELSVTGQYTARTSYGARGWVAHQNTDLWRATAPVDGPRWGLWPCGGAWLCNTLWDHYEYHPSTALLKRLYAVMKGASLFFLDTLVEDPKGRGLITSPSLSPENQHRPDASLCAGPAMDRQILRDLFAHTLQAHAELKINDPAFEQDVRRARERLPADRIGAQGQLQEWLEDWDAKAPEQTNAHVSHLYAVYPSQQINRRDTPDLVAAAKKALTTRGDQASGWAMAWRLALWARLGDAEHAYAIMTSLLGPARTYPNMFDAHPPFQIDGNFGGATGILEMIVQSWGGEIHLLPALPKAWPQGAVKGVRARGGIEVDLAWADGVPKQLSLKGPPNKTVTLRLAGRNWQLKLDAAGRARMNHFAG